MSDEMTGCAGMLLCGGKSSRMGQPKALLPFGETTLLGRTLATLETTCPTVILVASMDLVGLVEPLGRPVVVDPVPHEGPLRGLATGMAALDAPDAAVVVVACDLPFLTTGLLRGLRQRLGPADAVVIRTAEGAHPLCAVYRGCVGQIAEELLARGERRMTALLAELKVRWVDAEELLTLDPEGRALWNCNTPEDYARCLRQLEG